MTASLETLCGQAFGAGQLRQLGVYKQRAMLVLPVASVPVAVVWSHAGDILAWCGQDPKITAAAGSYIRWLIPALFVYGPLQCHVRFLQTQNIVVPMMLSSAATAVVHVAVGWLLVHRLGLGANGAALSNAVSNLANLSLLALYVRLSPSCKNTWAVFSSDAFRGIPGFLKLAHSIVLNCRCFKGLWSAKIGCLYQPCCLLPCLYSCSIIFRLHLPSWRKRALVWTLDSYPKCWYRYSYFSQLLYAVTGTKK